MLTRQFSYIKRQKFSIFYFYSEIVTWHEGIAKFRFKSSFKGHTVDFRYIAKCAVLCYYYPIQSVSNAVRWGKYLSRYYTSITAYKRTESSREANMFALLKRGSEYSIKLLLGVNIRANIFRMEKQNITISHEEGDMGVYGIAVVGFFSYGIRFFIILADGIRWNKIVHGITVPFICAFLSIQYAKQNTVAWTSGA